MDQDIQDILNILDEVRDEMHENNKMLKQMRRDNRMQKLGGVIRVVIYAAVVVASIMVLKPYIQNAKKIYSSVADGFEKLDATSEKIDDTSQVRRNYPSYYTGPA